MSGDLESLRDPIVPDALWQFQCTLRTPPDITAAELLAGYDEWINGGGPTPSRTQRGVAIDEVAGWRLTADLYWPPDSTSPPPVLVYLHGGAWVMGSPYTHRRLAAELAALGLLVVVPDYRRAPKHRFPAAVSDTSTVLAWARQMAPEWGADPDRLLVGGDSAGANLAAAALASGDTGVVAALLFYGIFDVPRALPLLTALVGGPELKNQLYLDPGIGTLELDDPRLRPERHCTGFPPSLVLSGSLDPTVTESRSMADALRSAGVPIDEVELRGAPHGALQLPGSAGHREGLAAIDRFLRRYVGDEPDLSRSSTFGGTT